MIRNDRGAAAVLVIALAGVLVAVGMTAAALGAVAVARHRAASAADLAALAAAERALDGPVVACAAATEVANAVSAELEGCRLRAAVAEVVVSVRPPGRLGQLGRARARARAGPSHWTSPTCCTRRSTPVTPRNLMSRGSLAPMTGRLRRQPTAGAAGGSAA